MRPGALVVKKDPLEYLTKILPHYESTLPADYRVELALNDSVTKVLRPASGWKPPTIRFEFVDSAVNLSSGLGDQRECFARSTSPRLGANGRATTFASRTLPARPPGTPVVSHENQASCETRSPYQPYRLIVAPRSSLHGAPTG